LKEEGFMRVALGLARKGHGMTSPNPMVGAVLVKSGKIIGKGWHRKAGEAHGEIEALKDADRRRQSVRGATLYVTLEPCSTHGRTPPCTDAIRAAGIKRVVAGATDPNPRHAGAGFKLLQKAGIQVMAGALAEECTSLNEAFNHWIVQGTPFVTVKAAMTMDGKIATAAGESKWITGEEARAYGMRLRQGADAVLVGVNTVLADDPRLTVRAVQSPYSKFQSLEKPQDLRSEIPKRRIVLDTHARTPLTAKVVADEWRDWTTIVVGKDANQARVRALEKSIRVLRTPVRREGIDVRWLLRKLGEEEVTSLLVEGGGEVNASFLLGGFAQRLAFFYAPKILGGRDAKKAVGGDGAARAEEILGSEKVEWRKLGEDFFMTARLKSRLSRRRQEIERA
jgi:diaminohydroxyphosphoribosylaminopyrimidine deaminase/5-amino-6-(5-phosphoribosylamino)uracil reductase